MFKRVSGSLLLAKNDRISSNFAKFLKNKKMSFIKSTASAFGKLFTVLLLSATFLFGMVAVVYMSLQGEEIKIPELVGKDINESEAELAKLGLKIKERAKRFSNEKQ